MAANDEPIGLLNDVEKNTLQVLLAKAIKEFQMRVRGQKSAKDLEVEARGREHAKAGYPFILDEQALKADEILRAAENKKREGANHRPEGNGT